ncbi:MAG: hypothetical protein JWO67_2171 [Streptosporangiaceae bacterium]|nr:hypothetical protein [Streptosporangiaceae bacterium]
MSQADVAGGWPHSPPRPRRRRPAQAIAGVLALVSLSVCAGAVAGLVRELTRPPTTAERERAVREEIGRRWQAWPAGKIFPATVPYVLDVGGRESARRVGIGPDRPCGTAVDDPLRAPFHTYGCRAVVRATYLDQLQGLAITVGVAVFPDEPAAAAAVTRLPSGGKPSPGLRTLSFAGAVASRFGDAARQSAVARHRGPYVVMATIGYADGRPEGGTKQKQDYLDAVAPQLAESVLGSLTAPARPDCSSPQWSC